MNRIVCQWLVCAGVVTLAGAACVLAGTGGTCYKQQNQNCCTEFWDQPAGPQHRPPCSKGKGNCDDQVFQDSQITKVIVAQTGRTSYAAGSFSTCKWYVYHCDGGVCKQSTTQSMAPCQSYTVTGGNCP